MTLSSCIRLDKWLWFARFLKSRTRAQAFCESRQAILNGIPVTKASTPVKAGDTLILTIGSYRHTLQVIAPGTQRGPASRARTLYTELRAPEKLTPTPHISWLADGD